jgi:hypothetical protein
MMKTFIAVHNEIDVFFVVHSKSDKMGTVHWVQYGKKASK